MGFHKTSATRDKPNTHVHLERKDDGSIYGVFKLGFRKDSPKYEYCFIGDDVGRLTFQGHLINRHPKFKNVGHMEGWCRRYTAEHDLTELLEK